MNSQGEKPAPRTGRRAAGRGPRIPFAVLVTGLIVGGLALLVALNTASAANELRRNSLTDSDTQIVAAIEQLRNEVAASAAPANLAAAAHRLGMVPADNPAFIVVAADGKAKVMGKPAAVTGAPPPVSPQPPAPHPTKTSPAHPSPTTTTTTTATTTAKATASTSTPARHATATDTASPAPSSPSPTPARPTPTPTPTLTLPGGAR